MSELRIGDVVRAKSGGPKMTIDNIAHDGLVRCKWFVHADLHDGSFSLRTLTVVPDESEVEDPG